MSKQIFERSKETLVYCMRGTNRLLPLETRLNTAYSYLSGIILDCAKHDEVMTMFQVHDLMDFAFRWENEAE